MCAPGRPASASRSRAEPRGRPRRRSASARATAAACCGRRGATGWRSTSERDRRGSTHADARERPGCRARRRLPYDWRNRCEEHPPRSPRPRRSHVEALPTAPRRLTHCGDDRRGLPHSAGVSMRTRSTSAPRCRVVHAFHSDVLRQPQATYDPAAVRRGAAASAGCSSRTILRRAVGRTSSSSHVQRARARCRQPQGPWHAVGCGGPVRDRQALRAQGAG